MARNESGEGRIRRSWRLTRTAWSIARRDPAILGIATVSVVASAAAAILIFWVAMGAGHGHTHDSRFIGVWAVGGLPLTFIGTYFNVALATAAAAALDGRRMPAAEALRAANRRLGQIALWSLLAYLVGVLLRQLAERVPLGARVITWLVGAAWGLATFFVVPILAIEGCTARACLRRSTGLMRERWGEEVTGNVAISAWTIIAFVPLVVLMMIGVSLGRGGAIAGVGIFAVGFVAIVVISSAMRQIFGVALYRYATSGEAAGGFSQADLEQPFGHRRRGLFRRR